MEVLAALLVSVFEYKMMLLSGDVVEGMLRLIGLVSHLNVPSMASDCGTFTSTMPGATRSPIVFGFGLYKADDEGYVHGCLQVNQDIQTIASGKYVDDRPEGARSPSPDPVYNENGIRVNSRDQRAKEKLQKQRYVSPCHFNDAWEGSFPRPQ